jgi:regulator of cell morphogenesis and NO signaling
MSYTKIDPERSIGEIVAEDFRTAGIFRKAGIDFCCGGKKSIGEACQEKSVDPSALIRQLEEIEKTPSSLQDNFNLWKLDFLCDYIMNIHHRFVLASLPELVFYTGKIASVHGEHHPELKEVAELFAKINAELLQHLKMEEEVLFPAIKRALTGEDASARETIRSEVSRMTGEHEFAGNAMDTINTLTSGYRIPEDACNTYRVALQLLEKFEDDLHVHVHLENNILYPKAQQI